MQAIQVDPVLCQLFSVLFCYVLFSCSKFEDDGNNSCLALNKSQLLRFINLAISTKRLRKDKKCQKT